MTLSPELTLIIWCICLFTTLGFIGFALIRLIKDDRLDSVSKLIWLTVIFLIPVAGPICFLLYRRNLDRKKSKQSTL